MSGVHPSTLPNAAAPEDEFEDDLHGDEGPAGLHTVKAPDWVVSVMRGDRSVFQLHRAWKQGTLNLDTDFQRGFLWKRHQQVRLIESVLARIPLPAIYLSEESEESTLVIDGLQRLTSLFRFMDGGFPLKGLQLLGQFEGQCFTDLEKKYQRRIEDTNLTLFSIQPGADPEVKFYLFERLNQGGVALNAQEIRKGIYRGGGLDLVQRLGQEGGRFREVAGTHRAYRRMKADELVLRCLAFQILELQEYPGDLGPFLNKALLRLNKMSREDLHAVEDRFLKDLELVVDVFARDAFKRFDVEKGQWGRHLNAAIMDLQMWGFRKVPRQPGFWSERRDKVIQALTSIHDDPEFRDSITYATSISSRVRYRLETWKEKLVDVARNHY